MVKGRGRHLSWHPPLLTTKPHQREDVSALDGFNVHRCPTWRVFSGTGLELVTSCMAVPVVRLVNELCKVPFTVWISGAVDLREYHCSILVIGLYVWPGQQSTDTGV
ncbi:hypothetical protein TNCV_73861 [Trichonephila clavipes]|nr:hypothetical protein TNCV_73861 [Trichonephila clavipes]